MRPRLSQSAWKLLAVIACKLACKVKSTAPAWLAVRIQLKLFSEQRMDDNASNVPANISRSTTKYTYTV